MGDINRDFSRLLLKELMEDVRTVTTKEQRAAAWVYRFGRQQYEFHGPDEFYWNGRADNAWDARFHGWLAWLEKLHPTIAEKEKERQK